MGFYVNFQNSKPCHRTPVGQGGEVRQKFWDTCAKMGGPGPWGWGGGGSWSPETPAENLDLGQKWGPGGGFWHMCPRIYYRPPDPKECGDTAWNLGNLYENPFGPFCKCKCLKLNIMYPPAPCVYFSIYVRYS